MFCSSDGSIAVCSLALLLASAWGRRTLGLADRISGSSAGEAQAQALLKGGPLNVVFGEELALAGAENALASRQADWRLRNHSATSVAARLIGRLEGVTT